MTIKEIKRVVKKFSGVPIKAGSRKTEYKVPRFIYYYMARKYTFATYEEIAKTVKQTHATILNGHRKYESEVLSRPEYKKLTEEIEKYIINRTHVSELPQVEVIQKQYTKANVEQLPILTDTQIVVFKDLLKLSDKDITNFRETRLKPYLSMLKSRRVHKVNNVQGATRNFNLKQI